LHTPVYQDEREKFIGYAFRIGSPVWYIGVGGPNMACKRCRGTGYLGRPRCEDVAEICPECLERGECPRCGNRVNLIPRGWFDLFVCETCEWTEEEHPPRSREDA